MNNPLMFRPDLRECVLEERALMAIQNLGVIIQTTSGLSLIIPFPGANASGAGATGPSSSTAASVSGVAIPTSFYITGTSGMSSLKPGNYTGLPSLAGAATGAAAGGISIQVGSGADTSDGPGPTNGGATNNVVGLYTVADPTQRPTSTIIGGMSSSSSSAVLPAGQSYHDTAPVQPQMPMGVINQSTTGSGTSNSGSSMAPNPQLGAPRLGPFNGNRGAFTSPLPGSLVPMTPMLPGSN
jgi:hypothetical protein